MPSFPFTESTLPSRGVGAVAIVFLLVAFFIEPTWLPSLLLGTLSVVLPQMLMIAYFRRQKQLARAFHSWAIKFSVTILFLSMSARGLDEQLLLVPLPFVMGVVTGLLINLVLLVRFQSHLPRKA